MAITRRRFLSLAALCASIPTRAFAQRPAKLWRVGYLADSAAGTSTSAAFREAMRDLGYVEGRNLVIEWRFADFSAERRAAYADELVRLKPDVIVTAGTQPTREMQKRTATIPIVMGSVGEPVASGFVKSLARPGGNITGLSNLAVDFSAKQLELLVAIVPRITRLAVLVNPSNSSHAAIVKALQAAAQKAAVQVVTVEIKGIEELDGAFATTARQGAGAVVVMRDALFNTQYLAHIVRAAATVRLPTMGGIPQFAEAGGLVSYGTNLDANYRRAAIYVDKILNGARPGDLPVEQPTTLELVINLKTARNLGLTVPPALLARADKVIE